MMVNLKSALSRVVVVAATSLITASASYGAAYSYYLRLADATNQHNWYKIKDDKEQLEKSSILAGLNNTYLGNGIHQDKGYDGHTYVRLPGDFINHGKDLFVLKLNVNGNDFFSSKQEAETFCSSLIEAAHESDTSTADKSMQSVFVSNWDGYFPSAIAVTYQLTNEVANNLAYYGPLVAQKKYVVCKNPLNSRDQKPKYDDEDELKGIRASGYEETTPRYAVICANPTTPPLVIWHARYKPNWTDGVAEYRGGFGRDLPGYIWYDSREELDDAIGEKYCRFFDRFNLN